NIAKEILSKNNIEFILHIELPDNNDKFEIEVWNLADIFDSIDRRNNFSSKVRVVSKNNLPKSLPWTVEDKNATP
ncbi:hypothetical protein GSY74_06695, partial [Sulfurovum sp. bin170]|uniref:hypothetical protein n=1 Tax=Sulfurovum sp. bin170 TaxID=2695268 RepID=UPI0013DEADDB